MSVMYPTTHRVGKILHLGSLIPGKWLSAAWLKPRVKKTLGLAMLHTTKVAKWLPHPPLIQQTQKRNTLSARKFSNITCRPSSEYNSKRSSTHHEIRKRSWTLFQRVTMRWLDRNSRKLKQHLCSITSLKMVSWLCAQANYSLWSPSRPIIQRPSRLTNSPLDHPVRRESTQARKRRLVGSSTWPLLVVTINATAPIWSQLQP